MTLVSLHRLYIYISRITDLVKSGLKFTAPVHVMTVKACMYFHALNVEGMRGITA